MRSMAGLVSPPGAQQWRKFSVDVSEFSQSDFDQDNELFQLQAGEVIHATKIKHGASWTGGTVSEAYLSIGVAGDLTRYASPFDVFQAPGNQTFQLTDGFGSENHGGTTSIRIELTTNGGFISTLTTGTADIWVLISKAV